MILNPSCTLDSPGDFKKYRYPGPPLIKESGISEWDPVWVFFAIEVKKH